MKLVLRLVHWLWSVVLWSWGRIAWVWQNGLPLFSRELTQLAAKKRTYVIRVLYAALLFWLGLVALSDQLQQMASSNTYLSQFGMLGSGRQVFSTLLVAQLCAIHLFMPALACSAITTEKERNTLGLLLMTKLSPSTILFEKLCSRLLPMVTCLMLSIPMMALSYSLGGLNFNELVNGSWLLLATCIQVACLTLLCSCFFRTTVSAFIWSYLFQIILFGVMMTFDSMFPSRGPTGRYSLPLLGSTSGYFIAERGFTYGSVWACLWQAKGIFLSTLVFFAGARFFLIRRATVASKSYILRFFKMLDGIFVQMNEVTGGIELVRDSGSLPTDKPIAWREVKKKSLGTARYLFRVFLVLELPTVLICLIVATTGSYYGEGTRLAGLACFLWAITALIVTIKSATLVASERASETLDVLLTTPLSGEEIIKQKCAGIMRVLIVVSIPLLTTIAFSTYMKGTDTAYAKWYCVWAVLELLVYLPLIAWLAIWIGLRVGSHTRSIFVAMGVLLFWVALPGVLVWVYQWVGVDLHLTKGDYYWRDKSLSEAVPLISLLWSGPSTGIAISEWAASSFIERYTKVLMPLHILFFGAVTLFLRWRVLRIANRCLGRGEATNEPEVREDASPMIPKHAGASHAMS